MYVNQSRIILPFWQVPNQGFSKFIQFKAKEINFYINFFDIFVRITILQNVS